MQRNNLTREMRWEIAEQLADDRLPEVNKLCREVIPCNSIYVRYIKRIFDIIVSVVFLIITLPINIVIGIITFFDVGCPVFFKQERIGKDEKAFTIVKFRNMRNTVDERGEFLPAEQRITKFGRFVRKTSIDELLNFWNVFKGDMSIIGPRPLVPEYTARYNERHKMRLAIRPGLECPPRAVGNHVLTWQEQFENDVWYVENVNFKIDVYLVFQLFRLVINRKSTKARANVTRGIFMGYDLSGKAITLEDVPQAYLDVYDNEVHTAH